MDSKAYNRRDVTSILEYLKEKASELSEGRWTDFSSGDIGSVLLGLMAYLADVNNFQIDKATAELFLDTAAERTSMMSILKLIGYEPRHYESAYTVVRFDYPVTDPPTDLSTLDPSVIPAYSKFTNETGTIIYTNLEPISIVEGFGEGIMYEGSRSLYTYQYDQITSDGRILLPDYKIGMNTVQMFITGVGSGTIPLVDDVRFITGEFAFSVHVNEYSQVYVQLPSYWTDLLTSTSVVNISYLITLGEGGRIGKNIINRPVTTTSLLYQYSITNPDDSLGGYFPETVEDLRISAPRQARTMLTIVTKTDMEDLVLNIPEIADIKAGDYNDEWTGFVQPQDAYKCKVLAVPTNVNEISLYEHEDPNDPTSPLIPTNTCEKLISYVDERRLASLMIYYEDPIRKTPTIELDLYTEESDLRANTIAKDVKSFMTNFYDRTYLGIGQSLFGSIIGRDLLNNFSALTYLEVKAPEHNIVVGENEYIDMYHAKFKIKVNDVLIIDDTI